MPAPPEKLTMKPSRRSFLAASTAAPLSAQPAAQPAEHKLDPLALARRHPFVRTQPTPTFFEGLLLGNGDIGLCLTVRPDALGLHIGKNDAWDIRVSEEHVPHVKTFQQVLDLWHRAGEEAKRLGRPDMTFLESKIGFFREYSDLMQSSYRKPWPRPWPCGTVWLHWDARQVRIVRQELDIASATATLAFEYDDLRGTLRPFHLTCFVHRENGHIHLSGDSTAPILSIAYQAHWDPDARLPPPRLAAEAASFSSYQHFPAIAPTEAQTNPPASNRDTHFVIHGLLAGAWTSTPPDPERHRILLTAAHPQPLRLDLTLFTPRDTPRPETHARREAARLAAIPAATLQHESAQHWAAFWSRSAVAFTNSALERLWYQNQYVLACCCKPGKVAPGLFGNWSSGKIGTAWHGDYHMNYNTQQVWWGVFSSNHAEQHEPYTRLVESLRPMAEWNARVQFGLPGLYFPHSAYPVPSTANPYPAPPWGYEICETPWTVQSLWWQYIYTLDEDYLRRIYPLLRGAAEFLAAFVKKRADGRYHISPTVSPENWGATVDFRLNQDCIIDLALTAFLLDAVTEAARVLNTDQDQRAHWREIRQNLAPYPEVDGPYGRVWLDVLNAPPEYVYNVPVTLAPVFPGEQVGLDRGQEHLGLARRTARTIRLEGGNDLVWQPLARARLGQLDLDWFLREVRYCTTPLGIANDRLRQTGGRYRDETNYDYMMEMGVWTENLSLPAVLNECLLQSYSGILRLFPNTQNLGPAKFQHLRAAGAFLVSAAWDGTRVTAVEFFSEKGAKVRLVNPWPTAKPKIRRQPAGSTVPHTQAGDILEFDTEPGGTYRINI